MAKIANVALTNTFDTWRSRSNEAFDRLSQFAINNSSLYANTLTANSSFTSKGLGTFNGRVTIGTNLNVSGNTTLGGASKTITMGGAASTLTIGGAGHTTNTTGWFGVAGRASISTNLFVGGNTTFGTNILGLVNITGRAAIGTNLTVSGNTTIGAAGKVANTTGWFGVNGRASISTNLFVGGNTTLNGTTVDKSNALSQTLTDTSGSIVTTAKAAWDVADGRVATITLTGTGRTMPAPLNLKVGTYILRVYQDATGSRTITSWNAVFKWTAAVAPVLSTGANKLDIITFFSDGTNLYGSYLPDMR